MSQSSYRQWSEPTEWQAHWATKQTQSFVVQMPKQTKQPIGFAPPCAPKPIIEVPSMYRRKP